MMATTAAVDRPTHAKAWLGCAFVTTVLWGVWGAFTDVSVRHGFPETMSYCVWAVIMIPPALYALAHAGWRVDHDLRAVVYGMTIGLLGAGGQLLLFYAVTAGPPYLIFPVVSLSPVITIAMSFFLLGERTNIVGVAGIAAALSSLPLLDLSLDELTRPGAVSVGWFALALIILGFWGVQAFFVKLANHCMRAESIFFYMTVAGLLLAPAAWAMTDFSKPINWGLDGPWLAALIQFLNAVGALTAVYAFRYGQAIVVSPLTNAGAPLMTAAISLAVVGVVPGGLKLLGLALACIAALLLSLAPEGGGKAQ
jgi:uncharacterized membrane protein